MGLCVQPNLSVALGTRPPILVRTRPQPYGYTPAIGWLLTQTQLPSPTTTLTTPLPAKWQRVKRTAINAIAAYKRNRGSTVQQTSRLKINEVGNECYGACSDYNIIIVRHKRHQ